ncbi:MAG: thermonuclease family protein [Ignavibacteria bacterium]|nr:thermonuclease family protein [Ignavibacteria bacterium]
MENVLYNYKAKIVEVYDGDTCTVDIDLGLHIWIKGEKIRLVRINAPELKGTERTKGLKSRDHLRNLILDKEVFIETIKDKKGKYGRYLAEVWLKESKNKFININDLMVKDGFAIYKKY